MTQHDRTHEPSRHTYAAILFIALSGCALLVACQRTTAETIVAGCAEAMGGTAKIETLRTLRMAQVFPDHQGLIRYEIKRPNLIRLGDSLVFDGERASWLERRAADGTLQGPELVPREEWLDFEVDIAWYVPAFFDHRAEYLGLESTEGRQVHHLRVPLPLGAVMSYYLDAETMLVHKVVAHFSIRGQEHHPERVYGDYREQDGILYPHAFSYQGREGVFTATIEELELNVPLGDDRFSVPEGARHPE